jgi:hypothetical protein
MANPHPTYRIPKGVSGNPGGRPKAHTKFAEMARDATKSGADLVAFAVSVWQGLEDGMDTAACRMWAHDWLTERGFGRPQPEIEIAGEDPKKPIDYSSMSMEELEVLSKLKASNAIEPETPPTLRLVTDDEPGGVA